MYPLYIYSFDNPSILINIIYVIYIIIVAQKKIYIIIGRQLKLITILTTFQLNIFFYKKLFSTNLFSNFSFYQNPCQNYNNIEHYLYFSLIFFCFKFSHNHLISFLNLNLKLIKYKYNKIQQNKNISNLFEFL